MRKFSIYLLLLLAANSFILSPLFAEEKEELSTKPLTVFMGGSKGKGVTPFPNDKGTRKIIQRTNLEKEGRQLAKRGLYEEAITKYKEAIHPSLLNREQDKATAMGVFVRIYVYQGKFDLALEKLDWFRTSAPNMFYKRKRPELEALIEARKNGSNKPIYEHIEYLKKEYKRDLPPKAYNTFTSLVTSDIIRLYDYIDDLDTGVAFVDNILAYPKMSNGDRRDYLKVRRAFEQDKAEGTKGRATQVLIQSNNLPW